MGPFRARSVPHLGDIATHTPFPLEKTHAGQMQVPITGDWDRARRCAGTTQHGELPESAAKALGPCRGLPHVPDHARRRGGCYRRRRHRIRPLRARQFAGQPCGAFDAGIPDEPAGGLPARGCARQEAGTSRDRPHRQGRSRRVAARRSRSRSSVRRSRTRAGHRTPTVPAARPPSALRPSSSTGSTRARRSTSSSTSGRALAPGGGVSTPP